MKKKKDPPVPERTAFEEEVVAQAKVVFEEDWAKKPSGKCSICGGEAAPISTEELCWVCRRLKISAWRDSEAPVVMQE